MFISLPAMMAKKSRRNSRQAIFNKKERKFLLENEVCRVSTSRNEVPHVTPVAYIYEKNFLFFATDYETRKYKNLKVNNRIAASIDIYNSSIENKAVLVQGTADIIEKGREFRNLYQKFYKKFEWVRKDPWKEGEAPFIKIKTFNKISWGL
jgi:nitroimidazol reductase NimA-like FMN-containing flavoprotein (pyridoxamine 5'-phosphate oxidase superfamily)